MSDPEAAAPVPDIQLTDPVGDPQEPVSDVEPDVDVPGGTSTSSSSSSSSSSPAAPYAGYCFKIECMNLTKCVKILKAEKAVKEDPDRAERNPFALTHTNFKRVKCRDRKKKGECACPMPPQVLYGHPNEAIRLAQNNPAKERSNWYCTYCQKNPQYYRPGPDGKLPDFTGWMKKSGRRVYEEPSTWGKNEGRR